MINDATLKFIREHSEDDVRQLALHPVDAVDMPFALNQIQGWQTARKKLPTWAETDGIIYPPHLNMEQCSSEMTARYKSSLVTSLLQGSCDGYAQATLVDLTGGFGVDFSFMARRFGHAVYVESDERLCEIARHNFEVLGLKNAEVVNGDALTYLSSLENCNHKAQCSTEGHCSNEVRGKVKLNAQRMIYLDPARRDTNGRKVYGIEDCTPDVLVLKDELLAKADCVMIKLSPMLDWHEAVRKLGDSVKEVHIVSVGNECKELLVVLRGDAGQKLRLVCINDDERFECYPDTTATLRISNDISATFLYVPNASIMKAGIFADFTEVLPVKIVDKNSHLFLSNENIDNFPGRKFRILATTTMNKKELKEKLSGITKANIAVRNFPLSVAELRKRLKLKDGGDTYLFATTFQGKHIIFITRRAVKVVCQYAKN